MGCAPCPSPCRGSIANCMTLVRMVIAPTAISPPYCSSDELKQTEITLSLACITKVEHPSARLGKTIFACNPKFSFLIFRCVLLPNRKAKTHMHDIACERIVARAAPLTPIPNPKMKMGSRMILATAPIKTESIPVLANPCAVMNAFIPRVSWTKIVPIA